MALAFHARHSLFFRMSVDPSRNKSSFYLTLMQVAVKLVTGVFPKPAVRRRTMIKDLRVLVDDFGKDALVDVASREVSFAKIRSLVAVVQLQVKRFGNLVV